MPIAWFPDFRGLKACSALAVLGACSAPPSAGITASPPLKHEARALPVADDRTPVSAKQNDKVRLAGGPAITVTVDQKNVTDYGPRDIKVFARYGSLIAFSDSYPSKPQGLGRCEAGDETWFRIIDTRTRSERYSRIVNSCLGPEVWGDPPVTVSPDNSEITLNLLSEPAITLHLTEDARIIARQGV